VTEQPEGAGGTTAHALQGRRILIVDDNVDAADSFAALLRLLDDHVRTARDGPEALPIAREQGPVRQVDRNR
jgi:two-component system CheB/CheR fusion protein